MVLCSHPCCAPVIFMDVIQFKQTVHVLHKFTLGDSIKWHTYSLQSVYQFPSSVTTLCCSNFVPLPPDPSPLLLLFGRLEINQR